MITEAAIVRAENELPLKDCWILHEKYAEKLPLTGDKWRSSPASPCEPTVFPQQVTISEPYRLSNTLHSLNNSYKQIYEISMDFIESERATRSLVYFWLLIFMIFTILFVFWVALYKEV